MSTSQLMDALRAWLSGTTVPAVSRSAVDRAFDHRLGGTLYHIQAPLSEFDFIRCQRRWATNVAAHLHRTLLLTHMWSDLPAPLVYKGADIAENLFDDPGARQAGDLDLIVPDHYFDQASVRLESNADVILPAAHEALRGEPPAGVGYRFQDLLIELHRDPQPRHRRRFSGSEIHARGSTGKLGLLSVRYPSPIDRVLLWVTNQAKTSFYSDLADLLDLTLAIRALGGAKETLWRAAEHAELARALDLCLLRARKAGFPVDFPPRASRGARLLCASLPDPATHRAPSLTLQLCSRWWSYSDRGRWETTRRLTAKISATASSQAQKRCRQAAARCWAHGPGQSTRKAP